MIPVEFNPKSNDNPFTGLRCCLALQQASNALITEEMLDNAWLEVRRDKQRREMFYSLLFSIGDVANRQHNIFKGKKVDNGGNSNRQAFEVIFKWMWKNDKACRSWCASACRNRCGRPGHIQ